MSVEIDPAELGFQRPFSKEVSQTLKIKNPSHTPVAFKVKTTAPKQYCVRPNSGRIEPGKEVEVNVLLQAMKPEPPLDAKCRDKFLVQSVAITADKEFANIWQHVDEAEKSSVHERKIRVVYIPASGASNLSTPQKAVNGLSHSESNSESLPAYRSPSPEESYTPATSRASVGPVSTHDSKPVGSKDLGEIKASAGNPAVGSTAGESISNATAAVAAVIPSNVEELKAQLAQAQATIAGYGKEGGLRMRKAVGATGDGPIVDTQAIRQQVSQGVPLQVVAALCLLSFLIAYFLF